jgi:acyl-homoserine-lactone acylase
LSSGILISLLSSSRVPAQVIPDSVTIIRDTYGVPHIYGATDADVAYGLAWANAEDDFYDMQLNMLMARHRLGEVKGVEGAGIDYAVQLLGVRALIMERYGNEVSPAFKKVLEGYAQGINAFAAAHPKEVLRPRMFPLDPIDILSGYTMSLVLLQGAAYDFQSIIEGRAGVAGPFSQRGSNGFAMNSSRTADGDVYFISNSHQPLEGPTAWYEAHLVSGEGQNCLGALFPGGVSIFVGTTPDLAWGHTVNQPDLTDVYRLVTRGRGKHMQYRFDGDWRPLKQGKAKMKVKLGPVRLTVRKKTFESTHGPVVKAKGGGYYALRFPAIMTIGAAEQWHKMNKATSFTEFHEALEHRGLPSLNIIYADRRDTIYYLSNALWPKRAPGYDWLGVLPGDTLDAVWAEFLPLSANVQVLNPKAGYVFNTNNRPFDCTAPAENPSQAAHDTLLPEYRWDNNRSIRFQQLMAQQDKVSMEELLEMKYDRQYPDSIYIYYVSNPKLTGGLDPAQYPDIADEIALLANWDKRGTKESVGAGFFLVTYSHFNKVIYERHELFERHEIPDEEFADAIRYAKKYLLKHFGTTQVPLGEVQRHVRGDKDWPIEGLPDLIAAMYSRPWKNGRFKSYSGESYIQHVRFNEQGVQIESVQPYGASSRP